MEIVQDGNGMQKYHDAVSGFSHLGGAVAAALGLVYLLVAGHGEPVRQVSSLVYGLSLIGMFSASATYHLAGAGEGGMRVLRKIDHSAIYLLIAGSYTPLCLISFQGFWHWGLLAIIWGFAVVGVTVKVFVINAPRWVTAGIYLVMGWISVLAVGEILQRLSPTALAWLVAGGLFFTVGAVIYILKKPNPRPGVFGFHEIWHIFVILGCLCHFILIAGYI
jgi:hemolysin III